MTTNQRALSKSLMRRGPSGAQWLRAQWLRAQWLRAEWLRALLVPALIAGCQSPAPAPVAQQCPEPATSSAAAQPSNAAQPSDAAHPSDELAKFDQRTPVPLQPMMAWHQKQNMMEHLVAIQRITDGLAREDWEEVGNAAALIKTSPQMKQMCEHMGAGAEGFTEKALEFHRRADTIAEAAEAKDSRAALSATSKTLQACTSCHATFRQEVVDAKTWQARTGQAHEPAMPHHGQ